MTSASGLGAGLDPEAGFPDFTLPDHAGNGRRLSELVGDDPTVPQFFRGWWCPKEQEFFRRMLRVQDAAQVAYSRLISVSVDAPLVNAAALHRHRAVSRSTREAGPWRTRTPDHIRSIRSNASPDLPQ
jgi:hypothetical protein